jgi:hypothetical protein
MSKFLGALAILGLIALGVPHGQAIAAEEGEQPDVAAPAPEGEEGAEAAAEEATEAEEPAESAPSEGEAAPK